MGQEIDCPQELPSSWFSTEKQRNYERKGYVNKGACKRPAKVVAKSDVEDLVVEHSDIVFKSDELSYPYGIPSKKAGDDQGAHRQEIKHGKENDSRKDRKDDEYPRVAETLHVNRPFIPDLRALSVPRRRSRYS